MGTRRIVEELTVANALEGAGAGVIDEAAGQIRNVLVCGFESANGRKYPRDVLTRDCARYENAKVNFNHDLSRDGRLFEDAGGWLSHVRPGPDGRPRATLNVYLTDPRAAKVFEAARRNPTGFGLSHVAHCETRREGDIEVVESIKRIESVDIVSDPATVDGLFESRHKRRGSKVGTVKEYLDRLGPRLTAAQAVRVKRLTEQDMAAPMPADAPPDDTGDPKEAVTAAFKAAVQAIVDQLFDGEVDWPTAKQQIGKLYKGHGDATGGGDGDGDEPADTGDGDSPADEPAPEGKRGRTDLAAVVRECAAAGYEPALAEIPLLLGTTSENRKLFIESQLKKRPGERPTQAGRKPGGTGGTTTGVKVEAKRGKDFLAAITE